MAGIVNEHINMFKINHFECFLTLTPTPNLAQGKGVFAAKDFTTGNTLFTEDPLVSAQFLWNETYRYTACEFCMRSMETAQEMAQRLTGNSALVLPHPECCTVKREEHTVCPQCLVNH